MRIRLVTTALLTIALAAGSAPSGYGADGEPNVLKRNPYYLSLHEAEGTPRGTVLLLHGGGWHGGLGPAADQLMEPTISALQGWGYDVANLGYRGGADSLRDATAAFDLLRTERGSDEPICVFGTSAGAQLGMIVAARRADDVACVVDLLGPPDLEEFGSQPKSARGESLARLAFGADRVAELSPINNVADIRAPVLVAGTSCDAFTPLAAQRALARKLRVAGTDAELIEIEPGDDVDLEHCTVDQGSFESALREMRTFLDGISPEPVLGAAPEEEDAPIPGSLVLIGVVLIAGVTIGLSVWRR